MIRAANLRYGRLAISNLRPKDKDTFLVELREEVDQDEICYKGQRIGAARILPKVPSKKRNLVDQFTQIWPDEFFNFDLEVIPVLERLVGSVCYRVGALKKLSYHSHNFVSIFGYHEAYQCFYFQARLEVLEEEEMKALEMQRKVFEEQKRKEEDDYNKYKNRVEMHMAEEKRQTALAAKLHRDEMNGDINTTLFAGVYIRYSYHEGVRASGEESQLRELVRLAVKNEAVSWLNAEVEKRVAQYRESTQLLDGNHITRRIPALKFRKEDKPKKFVAHFLFIPDIIRNAVADKEARIAGTMLGFPDEMETRVPPPTPGEFTDEEGFPAMPKNYPSWASGQED